MSTGVNARTVAAPAAEPTHGSDQRTRTGNRRPDAVAPAAAPHSPARARPAPSDDSLRRHAVEWFFRRWYWYVNRVDRDAEVLFLNYGYSYGDRPIRLDPHEEGSRYCIQLYRHVAESVALGGKHMVEVGSGRGGGLAYIMKTYRPAFAIGIELEPTAVDFCNRFFHQPGLSFRQGDAESLARADASCDVVLNVESSHRYPHLPAFLSEVRRILRPGGYLLLADFRFDHEMPAFRRDLMTCGLALQCEEDITINVTTAPRRDDARRRDLVRRMIPRLARGPALNFAGAVGSPCYDAFATRAAIYVRYVLQKAEPLGGAAIAAE